MNITLEWWQWVIPAIIAAAIVGINKGWRIMGLWMLGVFFSGLASTRIGPKIDLLLTKLISVAAQFFAIAADKDESSISTPRIQIASPWEPVATGLLFLSLMTLSWWVARRLAGGSEASLLGRLMGGAFGGLAAILGLSQAFDYWADFVRRSGSNPSGGAEVVVPQISVGVAGLPSTNPLMGLATAAVALFLVLVIVYTIWRALRTT